MSNHQSELPAGRSALGTLFQNRNFRLLWVSQLFGQAAQNAILFVHMVMLEDLSRSSALVGLMVLVYNLPGLLFGMPTGVLIDRFKKKSILLFCNVSRIFVVAAFIPLRRYNWSGGVITAVYFLTFVLSTIGQLSDPAEVAMVPLLVSGKQLLAANSAFRMLFNVAQVIGLLFLAPVSIKMGGIDGAFLVISLTYLLTSALIWPIESSEPAPSPSLVRNFLPRLSQELRAGWKFVISSKSVFVAICQHSLMQMLTMIVAVLAPGFVARVLGMQTTDSIYIFFFAGLGMFLVTLFTSRVGYRYRREMLVAAGLFLAGLALLGLSLVAWNNRVTGETVINASFGLMIQVVLTAFALGAGGTLATVAAQTLVQERTPIEIRGRVITAEFLFANIAGLIPMLLVSGLADVVGIPEVLTGLTLVFLIAAFLSYRYGLGQPGALSDYARPG
jgi:MFS family permease